MMKRLFYILVTAFHLLGSSVCSQTPMNEFIHEFRTNALRNVSGGLAYEDIDGSPYDSEQFIPGTVFMNNGKTFSIPLRHNLFNDEFEFMQDGKLFSVLKNTVKYIQKGDEVFYLENSNYYSSQESGKYSLYIRKKVVFNPKVPPKPYIDEVPAHFKREMDEYYLKEENMPPKEIKNKNSLQDMMGENKAALDFIKKSRIKVNKADDLLELVKFLNAQ